MGKMSLYESFAQATALGDLHTCLMMDMKACQEDDIRLLCYLTPSIYTEVHTNFFYAEVHKNRLLAECQRTRVEDQGPRH